MTNAELAAFVRRNPISFGCGVAAVLCVVAGYFVSGERAGIFEQLETKNREAARLSANLKNAAQLPEHLAALEEARGKIEGRLIVPDELAKNLQYFYRLESDTGVELIEIRQNATVPAGPAKGRKGPPLAYSRTTFSVSLRGPYENVLSYLRQLESGAHFCRVISASIDPLTIDRTGPVKLALTVEILGK